MLTLPIFLKFSKIVICVEKWKLRIKLCELNKIVKLLMILYIEGQIKLFKGVPILIKK